MRAFWITLLIVLLALAGAGWWTYRNTFPKPSEESVQLNAGKRDALIRLREEKKFEPYDYPPLSYMGIATPEDGVVARSAVNDVIESILSREDGPIVAAMVSKWIGRGMNRVDVLETEDRERTADYMIEIWYLLGFHGPTGRFAHGTAFHRPDGYGEPLPPGWKSPTEPRLIGRP